MTRKKHSISEKSLEGRESSAEHHHVDTNKKKIVKSTFIEVFGDTTMHGVPNIIKSKSVVMKSLWLCLFLAGVGGCIYYVWATLTAFFAYGTVTSVTKYLETIQTFPAVTICNINPFDTGNQDTFSYIQRVLTANGLNTTVSPSSGQYSIYLVREIMDVVKSSALSNVKGNGSFIQKLGFDLDTMLISCYFNGYTCSSADFYWYYTYEFGNCYIFNHDYGNGSSLKTVSQSGPNSGLQIELFAGYPGSGNKYLEQYGFYVSVNNNSQLPLTKFEGIYVPTGFASKLAIDKTYYYRLDEPYSDCRKDITTSTDSDSYYYKATQNITKYSQKLCFEICLQYEYIVPVCECADPSILIADENQKVCNTLDDIKCVTNVTNQFNSADLSATCAQYCPLECDSDSYAYSISMANYPTKPYYEIISKQSNFGTKFSGNGGATQDVMSQSCSLLNIYLSDLYYTEIDESPELTLDGVFGTIGGQLGLYLGASFLTFFELIEFAGNTLIGFYKLRKEQKLVYDSSQKI